MDISFISIPWSSILIQRGSGQLSAAQRGNAPYFPISFVIKRSQLCCRGIAIEPRAKFTILLCRPAALSLIFNDYKLPYSWGFGRINNVYANLVGGKWCNLSSSVWLWCEMRYWQFAILYKLIKLLCLKRIGWTGSKLFFSEIINKVITWLLISLI